YLGVCRSGEVDRMGTGGWGGSMGEEGSAASLIREAARAVALHLDRGGTPADPLVYHLFKALEIPSPARIGSRLSSLGNAKEVGQYAHVIFEAADAGSELADAVIREGGRALADLVQRLQLRGSQATKVVAGG